MGLTVNERPCWEATCDNCGEGDNAEYGGHYHYGSRDEAATQVQQMDWRELPDGRWLCPSCFEEERGEHRCPHGGPCNGSCGPAFCWPDGSEGDA